MSGRRSHRKGARTERCIVNALRVSGIEQYVCRSPGRSVVASLAISCCPSWAAISASK